MSKLSGMKIAGSKSAAKNPTACLSETKNGRGGVTVLGVAALWAAVFGRIPVLQRVLKDGKSVLRHVTPLA
jgi:hypothetical protein